VSARRVLALAAMVLVGACGERGATANAQSPAAALAPDPAVPDFNADSAFSLLRQQVAFGPRVPGTAAHQRQLEWMTSRLRARADTLVEQEFTYAARSGRVLRLTNLLARFRPEQTRRILLLAHWDTRPMADQDPDEAKQQEPVPGANDGASGVAVLLQLAEMLARTPAPVGVDLLFTDGEDYGPGAMYLGATHFAANIGGYRPLYAILIDMVGDREPLFPVEANSRERAPGVVQRVWGMARQLGLAEYFPERTGTWISDDHIPLNNAGIRAIDIIDFEYGPANRFWHTTADVVENTAPTGLGAVGTVLANLIYRGS